MALARVQNVDWHSHHVRQAHSAAAHWPVQSRIHISELDRAWQSPSQADLIRMALRYLLRQTQVGLVRIELPPEL